MGMCHTNFNRCFLLIWLVKYILQFLIGPLAQFPLIPHPKIFLGIFLLHISRVSIHVENMDLVTVMICWFHHCIIASRRFRLFFFLEFPYFLPNYFLLLLQIVKSVYFLKLIFLSQVSVLLLSLFFVTSMYFIFN